MKLLSFLVAGCLAALGGSLFAQSPVPDARLSLRVEGRQLGEVVEFVRERSGANIVILAGEESEQTPISIELTDVSWREVLEIAAEMAGCIVEERSAGVLALTKPERVTINFAYTELEEVIDTIAAASGANIIIAPEVSGLITLRLEDIPWRDALTEATKTLGFEVVESARGILRVVDPATLQDQMETRHYRLRFMRPRGNFVPNLESEFVNGQIPIPTGTIAADFPILQALNQALTAGGSIDFVRDANTLIVRDTAQAHRAIKEIIDRLDIEPAQVFFDIKFVSTTNADLWDLGVDYGDFGPRISASGSQIPVTLPFELGDGGFEDSIIAQSEGFGPFSNPGAVDGQVISPATIFGSLSFTGISPTLRLLQRDTDTEILQMPKLIALDGREATIFVGETIRYAEARTEQGQAGGLSLSVEEAAGSPVEVGFQLLVRPDIVPGTNLMMLEVIPKETSLSGTGDSTLAPAGFDVFTVGAAGSAGSIALPRVRSSTIVTTMKMESGETAMIGGLSTETDIESISRVPYLSDIPLLGRLFKHTERTSERRSLVVFITPTILRSSKDTNRILQAELERRRKFYDSRMEEILFGEEGPPSADLEAPVTGGDLELSTFFDSSSASQ